MRFVPLLRPSARRVLAVLGWASAFVAFLASSLAVASSFRPSLPTGDVMWDCRLGDRPAAERDRAIEEAALAFERLFTVFDQNRDRVLLFTAGLDAGTRLPVCDLGRAATRSDRYAIELHAPNDGPNGLVLSAWVDGILYYLALPDEEDAPADGLHSAGLEYFHYYLHAPLVVRLRHANGMTFAELHFLRDPDAYRDDVDCTEMRLGWHRFLRPFIPCL
ncbi:hypothetical protein [Pararhodobacter marinus]|uniref:hypothetical protein n=1 Tax=Pararhodobacter marinus TaxID=2184063 RepID=UPI0035146033